MAPKPVETKGKRKSGMVQASKKSAASNQAFYLLIAGIAVLGIGALAHQSTAGKKSGLTSPIDSTLPPVDSKGYTLGDSNAPVQVVEFADFECPACLRFSQFTEPDIRKKYVKTGMVFWRFIDFPLSIHRNTWNASRAAACADEQGKFWEYHDALFENQDRWNGEETSNPDKFMKQLGAQLGLDKAKFNVCVDDRSTQAKIQAHYNIAVQRQIPSTPTFYVGDRQHVGALSYDAFAKLLDSAIAKASAAPKTGGDAAKGLTVRDRRPRNNETVGSRAAQR